jgi:hypothetical protein
MDNAPKAPDAPVAEPEPSPYLRLPWPLVTAGLVGVLVVALAVGLFANRYLRPQVALPPTPIALAAPPASTPAPAATPAPTAAPKPLVLATEPPATATVLPETAVPTPPVTTPTIVATARPTVSPELAAEISEAYQHYWQVRAEALRDLDASLLPAVMAGEHLAAVQDRISELRAEGHAIETDVDHNYVVFEASTEDAKVADSYADDSVYVDLQTHARLTTPTGVKLNEVYIMTKTDGIWRVVSLVRSP